MRMSLQILSALLSALIFASHASALQIIGQSSIFGNVSVGQNATYNVTIYNDAPNTTLAITASVTGNVSNISSVSPSNFTVNPLGLANMQLIVSPTSQGLWTGSINVSGTMVPVTIDSAGYQSANWYQQGTTISISPSGYTVQVQNITSSSAAMMISQNGFLIASSNYAIGTGYTTPSGDFSMRLLDVLNNLAKIQINTPSKATQVTTSSTGTGGGLGFGGFTFYTTQYATTITTDAGLKQTFILRNGLSQQVMLKEVTYTGTVIMGGGQRPVNAQEYNLGLLTPGQEASFTVDINAQGLSPGIWTPSMTVKGLTSDGNIISTTINFVLTVSQGVMSPSQSNISISYPGTISSNVPFSITVTGLSSGMSIDMSANNKLVGTNVTMAGSNWTWTGYSVANESMNVPVYVKLLGGVFKTLSANLTYPVPPQEVVIIAPSLVWVGDNIVISTAPANATVSINGTSYRERTSLMLPGTYMITASANGYIASTKQLDVIVPVTANVSGDSVGKTVTVMFTRMGAYSLRFNSSTISSITYGNTISFTPSVAGQYSIYDDAGHAINTFTVKEAGWFSGLFVLPDLSQVLSSDTLLIGLFVVVIILVVVYLRKRGNKKNDWSNIGSGGNGAGEGVAVEEIGS